jgi:hypothetical protein
MPNSGAKGLTFSEDSQSQTETFQKGFVNEYKLVNSCVFFVYISMQIMLFVSMFLNIWYVINYIHLKYDFVYN